MGVIAGLTTPALGCGGRAFEAAPGGAFVDAGQSDAGLTDAAPSPEAGGVDASARGRVTAGLVALWEMQETSGDRLLDTSGQSPGVDLTLVNAPSWQRVPGAVRFVDGTSAGLAVAQGSVASIVAACKATNEISLELWIKDEATVGYQPALTLSNPSYDVRSFAIEVNPTIFSALVTTTDSAAWIDTPVATSHRLTHVVHTRASGGQRVTYIDAVSAKTGTATGAIDLDPTLSLTLGASMAGNRAMKGELHLAAIYARALSPAEVKQNFTEGADP